MIDPEVHLQANRNRYIDLLEKHRHPFDQPCKSNPPRRVKTNHEAFEGNRPTNGRATLWTFGSRAYRSFDYGYVGWGCSAPELSGEER